MTLNPSFAGRFARTSPGEPGIVEQPAGACNQATM
jgi:hypothetical protein